VNALLQSSSSLPVRSSNSNLIESSGSRGDAATMSVRPRPFPSREIREPHWPRGDSILCSLRLQPLLDLAGDECDHINAKPRRRAAAPITARGMPHDTVAIHGLLAGFGARRCSPLHSFQRRPFSADSNELSTARHGGPNVAKGRAAVQKMLERASLNRLWVDSRHETTSPPQFRFCWRRVP